MADWAVVCLLAATWVQLFVGVSNGWAHVALSLAHISQLPC